MSDNDDECADQDCSVHQVLYVEYQGLVSVDGGAPSNLKDSAHDAIDRWFKTWEGKSSVERGTVCLGSCFCDITAKKLKGKRGYSVEATESVTKVIENLVIVAQFTVRRRTVWAHCKAIESSVAIV